MAKPLVAIVGRPNVGKSMLFNKPGIPGIRESYIRRLSAAWEGNRRAVSDAVLPRSLGLIRSG